jgi:hypothetical protein
VDINVDGTADDDVDNVKEDQGNGFAVVVISISIDDDDDDDDDDIVDDYYYYNGVMMF